MTFSFYTTVTWKLPTPQKPLLAVGRGFFCRLFVANKIIPCVYVLENVSASIILPPWPVERGGGESWLFWPRTQTLPPPPTFTPSSHTALGVGRLSRWCRGPDCKLRLREREGDRLHADRTP